MKSISSQDYYIPYEQMVSLHEKGQLNFGIDRLTGQHLTNNQGVLQLVDDPALLKATWMALQFSEEDEKLDKKFYESLQVVSEREYESYKSQLQ